MGKFFGTDGVRGIANIELTCELAMNIGRAAGMVLSKYCHHQPNFVIGKDPRISSDMLECALISGICSVGANVITLGVVPTPAVAILTKQYKADAGFMISASHNPMEYNGIKIFNSEGYKLPDGVESEIEDLICSQNFQYTSHDQIGKITSNCGAVDDYINYVKSTLGAFDLSNMKIALDCANGSSSVTAEKLFSSLGAKNLIITNNNPNGININDHCGSTFMDSICRTTVENKCDIGFAFDGDADRCIAVDEEGQILDGDKIIAIMSKYLKRQGKLAKNTIVVTIMSNLGLMKMARENEIDVQKTRVGDRYVLEKMIEGGYCLGGEPSGHIILSEHATTGDGQLVAVHFLNILKESGMSASKLSQIMHLCPQVLVNVKIPNEKKYSILDNTDIASTVQQYESELGEDGRILLRPSGTEPLVRVMVEGIDFDKVNHIANSLSEFVEERLRV